MSNEKDQKTKPSLLGQWKNRKQQTEAANDIIARTATDQLIPAAGQQRLWFLQQLYPENPFYQYAHVYKINGKLDTDRLIESFQLLIDHHEILRSNFKSTNESVVITIQDQATIPAQILDLTKIEEGRRKEQTNEVTTAFSRRTFDLEKDVLLRLLILKISPTEHHLILSIHHIIGDRASLLLINEAVFNHYKNLSRQQPIDHPTQKIQYPDYALWQQKQKIKPADVNYWMQQLEGTLPILALPLDAPRPKTATYRGATISRNISSEKSDKIKALANKSGVTPYVLLLSAFKILLFRYSHQTDLLVGTPFSNRDKTVLEKLIGFFNETLVIRTQLSEKETFSQLVKKVKETTLNALAHKNMPFDELVRRLQPERHDNINPVFQAIFLYNNAAEISDPELDFTIKDQSLDLGVAKFDLTLFVNEKKTQLETTIEYATDIFSATTIETMLGHLENILTEVIKNPEADIAKISLLTVAEIKRITEDWNQTTTEMPAYNAIHQRITEVARNNPDATAVVFEKDELTYRQLNEQANQVAQLLLQNDLEKNQVVGLLADRSVDMVVGILGILKAGAAYLPLDPTYPAERIEYMIRDAGVAILLSQDHLIKSVKNDNITVLGFQEARAIQEDRFISLPIVNTQQMAYLIYTSGSTGQPKGVPISHKNLLHSTFARFSFYPKNPSAFLLLSSFSFDSSIVGIFWTLCSGGKLVLPQRRIEQDISMLSSLISKHQISHTLLLPSLYAMVLDYATADTLASLRNVMVAGEACPVSLIETHYKKLPKTELYNEYGPTEASVWCIAHKISPDEKQYVPIGKAIPNTEIYILDKHRQAVPIGVSGEIYVGGPGLSEGYLGRPELSKSRFVPHPFKPEKFVYRTGDLARYHPDGLIEFLGRVDQQVKIRGFRVEPEEIQKVMLESDLVREALVVVTEKKSGGTKQLSAYFVTEANANLAEIQHFLEGRLPNYMVPAVMVPLKEFPRLPNGKIDRNKLPEPTANIGTSDTYTAPSNPLETKLVAVWEAVLATHPVGIHDNFFAIGGDSILSIQIVSKARAAGISLKPNQLFEYQSVAALAKSIVAATSSAQLKVVEIIPVENPVEAPLSYLQNAFLFNHQRSKQDQGQLPLEFEISGTIDIPLFQKAWADSVQRHDAMRAQIQTNPGSQPIQVISANAALSWQILDWSKSSEADQVAKLKALRTLEENTPLNLAMAPVSRMHLIKLSDKKSLLFWVCHHIFLDGWSCGIVLKDALRFYEGRRTEQPLILQPLPNYPAFLQWQQAQDDQTAKEYWKEEMDEFSHPLLFKTNELSKITAPVFLDDTLIFTKTESTELRAYCQKNEIALSTLFQGLWAFLLGQYFQTTDITYGLTVSGRFTAYPEADKISGLFMNILPNRFTLSESIYFSEWLKEIQRNQGQKNTFDSFSFEEIKSAINWPLHSELFHSLFVFGNFLKDRLTIGTLTIEDFKGGFSSTYPLTIRINPTQEIEVNWRFDSTIVSKEVVQYFKTNLQALGRLLTVDDGKSLRISQLIPAMPAKIKRAEVHALVASDVSVQLDSKNYIAPRNQEEMELVKIWETLFGIQKIGTHDNYFELGGNSLLAIQLFAEIERKMKTVLPPATLFQHPTIAQIAQLINGDPAISEAATSLVPLRIEGNKSPLFCLHGGGAHVFFYQGLCKNLSEDQPVYTLQPPGLDGVGTRHQSIEEMAAHYVEEIQQVQPDGPYHLLGTCFSNAVALEMGNQLLAQGKKVAKLFIIDSAPVHLFGNDASGKNKTFSRFYDMLKRGDFQRIKSKLVRRFQSRPAEIPTALTTESESEKNLRLTIDSLNTMYANYHWQPYNGKIIFIRSTEFHNRTDKNYHLTQWNKLAKEGIELHVVPGHHLSLFEEPEVRGLAEKVGEVI